MSKIVKLAEIASLKTGPFGTQFSAKEYTSSGIPVINVKNIGYGQIIEDELEFVNEQTRDRLSDHVLQTGDIVFGRKGSVDRHAFISEKYNGWLQGSDCIRLRFQSGINTRYISHFLKLSHIKKQINCASVGSTMASLNTDILKNIEIVLPSLKTQTDVESVLSALERKIEINIQVCIEIETLAKTLYDYWFTQFDFPNEEGKPYRSSGGAMEWSAHLKREIPKGWSVKKFCDICSFRNGINYEKGCTGNRVYRIANVRNITASSLVMDVSDFDEILLPDEQADRYLVKENDIIIARSGTPGATRLIFKPADNVIFCGFIICGSPIKDNHRTYLTYFLKQLEGTSATKTGGSILQNVSQDTLKSLHVVVPDDETIYSFNEKITPMFEMMQNIIDENCELTKLRDWLLPMLMNGQATVSD